MIQSMTGFGKADVSIRDKSYRVSLKSVNSKNVDFNIKLPSAFKDKEGEVRLALGKELQRGKIDLFISVDSSESEAGLQIDEAMLKTYLARYMELSKGLNISDDTLFTLASKMPNVLVQKSDEDDEGDWTKLMQAILSAANQLIEFRMQEGAKLEHDLSARLENIQALLLQIEPHEKERIVVIRERLEKQLEEVGDVQNINRDRFEQELIYYLEKLDITEEKVRLKSHCSLFKETLEGAESQGRKLGFISQEMGREINTIGSKANNAEIQKIVVDMKDELEKIKEQLFNIL